MRHKLTKEKFLSDTEVEILLQSLRLGEEHRFRDVTLIRLALFTGARASELLAITRADLDDVDKTVYIRGLKGSNDRCIPLPEKLYADVIRLCADGIRPFPFGYQRLYQIWLEFRPGNKKFHACRHYCALRVYRATKDLKLVQSLLGHRSLSNTYIYLDFQYSSDELRKLLIA